MKVRLNLIAALALGLAFTVPAVAQLRPVASRLSAGKLLVAAPGMHDPDFARTIVLVLSTGNQGTIGLIINEPTWVTAAEVSPDIETPAGFYGTVYRGGPLRAGQVVYLVRGQAADGIQGHQLLSDVYIGTNPSELASFAATGNSHLRLYAGHAAWSANQLRREIAVGQWFVMDGKADWIFSPAPSVLWQLVTQRASRIVATTGTRRSDLAIAALLPRTQPAYAQHNPPRAEMRPRASLALDR